MRKLWYNVHGLKYCINLCRQRSIIKLQCLLLIYSLNKPFFKIQSPFLKKHAKRHYIFTTIFTCFPAIIGVLNLNIGIFYHLHLHFASLALALCNTCTLHFTTFALWVSALSFLRFIERGLPFLGRGHLELTVGGLLMYIYIYIYIYTEWRT